MKRPYLGWTKDQKVLDAQREYYGYIYKKWYNKLFRYLKKLYKP